MAIDDTREWWTGTEMSDIPVYVAEITRWQRAYPATGFRAIRCGCGSEVFRLVRARDMTQRTCAGCGQVRYVSRGRVVLAAWQEAVHEEKPEPFRCVGCKGRRANICVGFAGYPEAPHIKDGVKWFYVGIRCCKCGILGMFNDGKVGRTPADEVYPEVTGEVVLPAEKPKRAKKSVKRPKRKTDRK